MGRNFAGVCAPMTLGANEVLDATLQGCPMLAAAWTGHLLNCPLQNLGETAAPLG